MSTGRDVVTVIDTTAAILPGRASVLARARPALARLKKRNWLAVAVGPVLYTVLAFALMSHAWVTPSTLIGSGGDPYSYLWDLQWPAFALTHGDNPFYSFYLVAPNGTNLTWGASLGPGIVLAPFVRLFGAVFMYNLLATMSLALSAWFAQLAIYRLVPSRVGAIAGGLFFGFSPYMMGHALGHLTITMAFLPPLMLIALHEALVRQKWRWWLTGLFAGVILAYQLVTFIETVAIVAVAAVIVVVALVAQCPRAVRDKWRYAVKVFGATVAAFLVFGAYPLRTLLFGAQRLGRGTVEAPGSFVNDVWNFVVPTVTTKWIPSILAATSQHVTDGVESGGYIGLPILAICVITVIVLRREILVRTAAIAGFLLAALSLGPRLHVDGSVLNVPLPFALLLRLPFLGNILAARFMGVADLCVGVLLACFVAHLADVRVATRWLCRAVLVFGLLILTPAPLPWVTSGYSIPAYFTSAAVDRIPFGSTALVAPWDADGSEQGPQLWQAASGFRFKMPEGYVYVPTPSGPITGPVPRPLTTALLEIVSRGPTAPAPALSLAMRRMYRVDMRAMGVTTVLVGPMPNYAQTVAFFTELLRRPGQISDGITAWYNIKR